MILASSAAITVSPLCSGIQSYCHARRLLPVGVRRALRYPWRWMTVKVFRLIILAATQGILTRHAPREQGVRGQQVQEKKTRKFLGEVWVYPFRADRPLIHDRDTTRAFPAQPLASKRHREAYSLPSEGENRQVTRVRGLRWARGCPQMARARGEIDTPRRNRERKDSPLDRTVVVVDREKNPMFRKQKHRRNKYPTHVNTVSQPATAVAFGVLSIAGCPILSSVKSSTSFSGITPGITFDTRQYIEHWQHKYRSSRSSP